MSDCSYNGVCFVLVLEADVSDCSYKVGILYLS